MDKKAQTQEVLNELKLAFDEDNVFMVFNCMDELEALLGEKKMLAVLEMFAQTMENDSKLMEFLKTFKEGGAE